MLPPSVGHTVDTISALAIVGSLLGYLPALAAVAAIAWYAIQIYESRTVQHWLANRRMMHAAKELIRLRAKQKVIHAEIVAAEKVRAAKAQANETVQQAKAEAVLADSDPVKPPFVQE